MKRLIAYTLLLSAGAIQFSRSTSVTAHLSTPDARLVKGGTCYTPATNFCPQGASYTGCESIMCPMNNKCPNWPDVYGLYKSNITTYNEAVDFGYSPSGRIGIFLFPSIYCADIFGCLEDCDVLLVSSFCKKDPMGQLPVGFDKRDPSVPDPNTSPCDDVSQNDRRGSSVAEEWLVFNGGTIDLFAEK